MKRELLLVVVAISLAMMTLILLGLTSGCAVHYTKPDVPVLITPESTYYIAQGSMRALAHKNATLATIVCREASETLWPILESASEATIELKDEIIGILTATAERYGMKGLWLDEMWPVLGFIGAAFQPDVTFKDNWLEILRGFVGGIIDACEGTPNHKPL